MVPLNNNKMNPENFNFVVLSYSSKIKFKPKFFKTKDEAVNFIDNVSDIPVFLNVYELKKVY